MRWRFQMDEPKDYMILLGVFLLLWALFPTQMITYLRFRYFLFWGMGLFGNSQSQSLYLDEPKKENPHNPDSIEYRSKVFALMHTLVRLGSRDPAWKAEALLEGTRRYYIALRDSIVQKKDPQIEKLLGEELYKVWNLSEGQGLLNYPQSRYQLNRIDIVGIVDKPGETHDQFTARIQTSIVVGTQTIASATASLAKQEVEYWTFGRKKGSWRLNKVQSAKQYEA